MSNFVYGNSLYGVVGGTSGRTQGPTHGAGQCGLHIERVEKLRGGEKGVSEIACNQQSRD
jgi:hypothetical protein